MTNFPQPDEILAYNAESLQTLTRAITLSSGQFSLILVRCNYISLRNQVRQQLSDRCSVEVKELWLQGSAKTLYTSIKTFIETDLNRVQPSALMVLGFETLTALEDVLTATNQVRNEFEKNFAFPLILWVSDRVLQKLAKRAPDFNSWAGVPIRFVPTTEDLIELLQSQTDRLFDQILHVGAGRFPHSSAPYQAAPYSQLEMNAAVKDLQDRQQAFASELEASLQFIWGFDAYAKSQRMLADFRYQQALMRKARYHYRHSLRIWQQQIQQLGDGSPAYQRAIERRGCLLFYLGLLWRKYAVLYRAKYLRACYLAKAYYERCVNGLLQANRPELAAKFINALGEVLQRLAHELSTAKTTDEPVNADPFWTRLETVANQAIELHRQYSEPVRLAYSYALLAEVAIAHATRPDLPQTVIFAHAKRAQQYAEQAIQINRHATDARTQPLQQIQLCADIDSELNWARPHYHSLYLLLLVEAQQILAEHQQSPSLSHKETINQRAIVKLKAARRLCRHDYDPILYTRILRRLQSLYYEQGKYLKAFEIRQERRSIEQQYGLRAFIGAGHLQPARQVVNPTSVPIDRLDQTEAAITVAQEIIASGRQKDVDHLIQRLSSTEHNLIIIHGQSGVGKSSIISAGLVPALEQHQVMDDRHVLPVVLDTYTDWINTLSQRLADALKERSIDWKPPDPTISTNPDRLIQTLIHQLRANEQQGLLTVLIFDQFEEFFFFYPQRKQQQLFFDFFRTCLKRVPFIKFIVSIRQDYLHYLLEANAQPDAIETDEVTQDILGWKRRYAFGNFSPDYAKQIIQRLTQRSQFSLKDDLIEQLVQDLAKELGEVRPIELQIVGAQLQEERISTLARYKDLGDHPKEKLIERFVKRVLEDCGPPNEETAELVLYLLTDEKEARPLKTLDELAENLLDLRDLAADLENDLENNLEAPDSVTDITLQLKLVLEILVKSGLVLRLPEVPDERYRLAHDYLVDIIQRLNPDLREQISELKKRNKLLTTKNRLLAVQRELAQEKARQQEQEREQEKQEREQETQRLRRDRHFFTLAAGIGSLLALIAIGFGLAASNQATRATIAETEARAAQAAALVSTDQLRALLTTIRAGRQLQKTSAPLVVETSILGQMQNAIYAVREQNRLVGHEQAINGLRFNATGQQLASASDDQTVRLWSAEGELLNTFRGHTNRVNSVVFSPDDRLLASASDDRTIKLWAVDSNQELQTLEGHGSFVTSLSFSRSCQLLASGSDDETIKLWEINETAPTRTLQGHEERVKSVSFSPDGQTLASGGWDGRVRLWNCNGEPLPVPPLNHGDRVSVVTFSPDGQMIASGGLDGVVNLWSRDGDRLQSLTGQGRITSISFSPDGATLAFASASNAVKLWTREASAGVPRFVEAQTLNINKILAIEFSPDGRLASTGSDNTIRLWNLNGIEPTMLSNPNSRFTDLRFGSDQQLITGGMEEFEACRNQLQTRGQLLVWNLEGKRLNRISLPNPGIYSVSFSQDGQWIGSVERSIEPTDCATAAPTLSEIAQSAPNRPHRLTIWDANGVQQAQWQLPEQVSTVNAIAFRPRARQIAVAATAASSNEINQGQNQGRLIVWNLAGQEQFNVLAHDGAITDAQFSPDGRWLASGGTDNQVKLWTPTGELQATLPGHMNQVNRVRFSPDSKTLASASDDTTIHLWDLNGELQQVLTGHTSPVMDIDFDATGQLLVSASSDGIINLWNVRNGRLLATLEQNTLEQNHGAISSLPLSNDTPTIALMGRERNSSVIRQVRFSADSRTIASLSEEGVVLWEFNLDILLDRSCTWLQDYLRYNPNGNRDQSLCPELDSSSGFDR
ncbi:MAG: hypothetical protein Kow00121_56710 [Elainellaceae cyanobacterium]